MDKWDYRFLKIAKEVSTWSLDPSRKIGALIAKNKQILSTGYNGFPRGVEDSEFRLSNREIKYSLIVHAELNCILNATNNNVDIKDSTIYIYGLPVCGECCKAIIQSGITRIIMDCPEIIPDKWNNSWNNITKPILEEVGIEYKLFKLGDK